VDYGPTNGPLSSAKDSTDHFSWGINTAAVRISRGGRHSDLLDRFSGWANEASRRNGLANSMDFIMSGSAKQSSRFLNGSFNSPTSRRFRSRRGRLKQILRKFSSACRTMLRSQLVTAEPLCHWPRLRSTGVENCAVDGKDCVLLIKGRQADIHNDHFCPLSKQGASDCAGYPSRTAHHSANITLKPRHSFSMTALEADDQVLAKALPCRPQRNLFTSIASAFKAAAIVFSRRLDY